MSASEAYEILLHTNLDLIESPSDYYSLLNVTRYDNIYEIRQVIDRLSRIEGLANDVANLKDSELFTNDAQSGGFVTVSVSEAEQLDRYMHDLHVKAVALMGL